MTYAPAMKLGEWAEVRTASSAIAADNSTLIDANIPPASALNCRGLETVWVMVAITGGSSPTMILEALFRDDTAADGSKWTRQRDASGLLVTAALAPGVAQEVRVDGWLSVFLRVTTVANESGTTAWKILVRPGKPRVR